MSRKSRPSSEITSDGAAFTLGCVVMGILLISNGTADPKVILHDNTAASGLVIGEYSFDVSLKGSFVEFFSIPHVSCFNGIYVTITGTGASCIVYAEPTGGQT